mmetsp:Transcript_95138/g.269308  ORF Transcript_95138/g.269308 Transcript_95138/m.269308 type:complete len:223 (+) Transcript_95138:209-877(+)
MRTESVADSAMPAPSTVAPSSLRTLGPRRSLSRGAEIPRWKARCSLRARTGSCGRMKSSTSLPSMSTAVTRRWSAPNSARAARTRFLALASSKPSAFENCRRSSSSFISSRSSGSVSSSRMRSRMREFQSFQSSVRPDALMGPRVCRSFRWHSGFWSNFTRLATYISSSFLKPSARSWSFDRPICWTSSPWYFDAMRAPMCLLGFTPRMASRCWASENFEAW